MRPESEEARRSQSHSPQHSLSNGSNGLSPSVSKYTNGHSYCKADSNGANSPRRSTNGVGSAKLLPPLWFGHNREEVARILIQALTDLGYHTSARALSRESTYELEGPTVAAFRTAVLQGEWAEAEALLFGVESYDGGGGVGIDNGGGKSLDSATIAPWADQMHSSGLTLAEGADKAEMLFWMRQQKYLELLERRDLGSALLVLRQELTPLHQDTSRLHALSSLMMCQSSDDLKIQAQWDGADGQSRNNLLSELSKSITPSVMIPESRLGVLLDQVKQGWMRDCLYHNTDASPSLYVDHMCEREDFPMEQRLVLTDHSDEVWYLAFSHNGQFLATGSKDALVNIYDTKSRFTLIRSLSHDEAGVPYVAWSPDDRKLITCTKEPDNQCRIWSVQSGDLMYTLSHFQYSVTAATWVNNETFIVGSQDSQNSLSIWSLEEEMLYKWKDEILRVYDLALSANGRRLVVLLQTRVVVYDFPTREKIGDYVFENVRMTSVRISKDSQYILVGMNENRLKLLFMETGETIQTFSGQKQTEFMIKSCFGGANENFIASGSEGKHDLGCIMKKHSLTVPRLEGAHLADLWSSCRVP